MHGAHGLMTRWPELDVAGKRARLDHSLHVSGFADAAARSAAGAERAARGLWQADPSAWSADPATEKEIGKWLGWMQSPMLMADTIERLKTFAASIKRIGFTDIVLLGMGGSSLAPEVLRASSASRRVAAAAHARLDRSLQPDRDQIFGSVARCR